MPDYNNSKIYKLWSPQGLENEIYYGSTCNDLRIRLCQHKTNARKCSSHILFEKYDDVRIDLVEECPCENKEQLSKREGYYIRNNSCLNKQIPDRKPAEQKRIYYLNNVEHRKQYREQNKEHIKEQWKQYHQQNKDKINEKKREKITCECGAIISRCGLARHRKTQNHIDFI